MPQTQLKSGFAALNVASHLIERLDRTDIHTPTPIQAESIPLALEGRDVLGLAQTGTGKTLAFGLPMAELVGPQQVGLVLAPTRELAQQISETFGKLGIRAVLIVGGASMKHQVMDLRRRPRIIVATPGRLIDHLEQRTLFLDRVSLIVLDEADRMLDMGFEPAIRRILSSVPTERQTLLFSATMPESISGLAHEFMKDPVRVEVNPVGSAPELVEQEIIHMKFEDKPEFLSNLLYEHSGTVLVFARTRHGARKLAKSIRQLGHTADEIHADRTLAQRREAMRGFKDGTHRILVATDIAARGIDVKEISLVLNYDMPDQAEDYLHRIGRTGRAGAEGQAISFVLPEQRRMLKEIEKLMGSRFEVSDRSTVQPKSEDAARGRRRRRNGHEAPMADPTMVAHVTHGAPHAHADSTTRVSNEATGSEERTSFPRNRREFSDRRDSGSGRPFEGRDERTSRNSAPPKQGGSRFGRRDNDQRDSRPIHDRNERRPYGQGDRYDRRDSQNGDNRFQRRDDFGGRENRDQYSGGDRQGFNSDRRDNRYRDGQNSNGFDRNSENRYDRGFNPDRNRSGHDRPGNRYGNPRNDRGPSRFDRNPNEGYRSSNNEGRDEHPRRDFDRDGFRSEKPWERSGDKRDRKPYGQRNGFERPIRKDGDFRGRDSRPSNDDRPRRPYGNRNDSGSRSDAPAPAPASDREWRANRKPKFGKGKGGKPAAQKADRIGPKMPDEFTGAKKKFTPKAFGKKKKSGAKPFKAGTSANSFSWPGKRKGR